MRILFVVHQFFPEYSSGTESVTLGLATMMQKAGHTVQILSCNIASNLTPAIDTPGLPGAKTITNAGVPTTLLERYQIPATADFSLEVDTNLVSNLTSWYQHERFDLVHCLHTMRMVSAIVAANQLRIPIVFTLTDFFLPCFRINLVNTARTICGGPSFGNQCGVSCSDPPWTKPSLKQRYEDASSLLTHAAERVVPSRYMAEKFRHAFPELSFRVIPHGLDVLARLATTSNSDNAVLDDEGALRLAFVGTIVPQKGLHVLIKALSLLSPLNIKLSVAGPFGNDKAYEEKIRNLASSDKRITLLGPLTQQDVSRLFLNTDLLCLPSQVPESFSLTLREAALFGVPALTSDLGAQKEFVLNGLAGGTAIAYDISDWASKLETIASTPELLTNWRTKLPLPMRIEEEAFLYQSLYQLHASNSC